MPETGLLPATAGVPVAGLSIFDPIDFGLDELGRRKLISLIYRNILIGGEPGGGKSVTVSNILAHAALSNDVRLWLFDGKLVELGLWWPLADVFVGPDLTKAIEALKELQAELDRRYVVFLLEGRRKIMPADVRLMPPILFVIDELALFTATMGTPQQREEFETLLKDIVARGRACGIITVAATQRPDRDVIKTGLRDLFAFRLAHRCTAQGSSDVVLGHSWASQGFNAVNIDPLQRGVGLLLAEGGTPEYIRVPDLSNDDDIKHLVRVGTHIRGLGAAAKGGTNETR